MTAAEILKRGREIIADQPLVCAGYADEHPDNPGELIGCAVTALYWAAGHERTGGVLPSNVPEENLRPLCKASELLAQALSPTFMPDRLERYDSLSSYVPGESTIYKVTDTTPADERKQVVLDGYDYAIAAAANA